MVRRRTLKGYQKQVEEKFGEDYSIIGKYLNDSTSIKTRHNLCGTEWSISPKNLLRSKTGRCPKCYPRLNKKMSQKDFDKKIYELVGGEYTFLEPYKNAQTKILCKHKKCGFTWGIKPANFISRKVRCPNCQNNVRKNDEFFRKEISKLTHGEYSVIGEYVNAQTPIKIVHHKCNYVWSIKPYSFISGTRCPKCNGGVSMSEKEFIKRVAEVFGKEYSVLDKYKSAHTSIRVRHNRCGEVFQTKPYILIDLKRGCPVCRESHGERRIREYLIENQISFEAQKKFSDCKDRLPLPFDFYLNDYNLVIEYDGEQHFKPVEFFGGKKSYELRHKHDLIKDDYCKQKGISILRIPYTITDEYIDSKIQKQLNNFK